MTIPSSLKLSNSFVNKAPFMLKCFCMHFTHRAVLFLLITIFLKSSLTAAAEGLGGDKPPEKEAAMFAGSDAFEWQYDTPENHGMSSGKLEEMRAILAVKGTRKLIILKDGKVVYEWFAPGWGDQERTHYTASLAKALVGGMSLLAAVDDGYISLDEAACHQIPAWRKHPVKSKITIRHLATHSSGIEDAEARESESKLMADKELHPHFDLPGWKGQFWRREPDPFTVARDSAPVMFTPGARYAYSNPGIAMLNLAVASSLKGSTYASLRTYLKERVFDRIGIDEKEYQLGYGKVYDIDGTGVTAGWGGGNFTARGVARIGLLMLNRGAWLGEQVISSSAVDQVVKYWGTALPSGPSDTPGDNLRSRSNPIPASTAGWYSNYDGVWNSVPRDAFAGGGAGNQHLLVIPSLDMVVVRMGEKLYEEEKGEGFWLGAEKYLFNPVMDAITGPPYPMSPISVEFAPAGSVIRQAEGSDCWPATWGSDGVLYTAYGDGNGFKPYTDIKLSLGLATVTGTPPGIKGTNLRSPSGERVGQGQYGEKASGLLMVGDVLYMLVRNAGNSVLMWSEDKGSTWEQAAWKFEVSFGYPTFLNYGPDYEGATDAYVYIYSHDEASAYRKSDHFVLARVPKDQIRDWRQYRYFAGYSEDNQPVWSEDIRKRAPVFTHPGNCYRSGITWNPGLRRYLWCQTIQVSSSESHTFDGGSSDVRFRGGLGIFESENPWGPWKTVFYTREWDIGPGETSSIPPRWLSGDGRKGFLLFSGDDFFSLRELHFKER